MSEPVLELTNASVIKNGRRVLDGISLTIHVGEHTAIVGPNGAGKSMLVKLLTHDERAVVGKNGQAPVRVFGSPRWNVFELRSQLGIVSADLHHRFLAGNSEGRITGEAAVLSAFLASHGILRYGVVTDQMRTRAAEVLARLGVPHLADRRLDEMSSGEARRVLLARALVTSPRALVLDEPTTGLDLVARHEFMERVRRLARAATQVKRSAPAHDRWKAATIILITHHIDEIVPEIERVILLRHGRITADGPKRSIMTSRQLSEVFEAPISINEAQGYYYAHPRTALGSEGAPNPPSPRS